MVRNISVTKNEYLHVVISICYMYISFLYFHSETFLLNKLHTIKPEKFKSLISQNLFNLVTILPTTISFRNELFLRHELITITY